MEVLNLLRLSGVSSIIWHTTVGRVPQWNSPLVLEEGKQKMEQESTKEENENEKKKKKIQKTRRFIFNFKQTVSQGSRRISVYPTLDHYLVKYVSLEFSYIPKPICQLLRNLDDLKVLIDRRALVQYVDLFFFYFLLGKTKLFADRDRCTEQTSVAGRTEILDRPVVCYVLLYVCTALQIWLPNR